MIVDIFMTLYAGLLEFLSWILPSWDLPAVVSTSYSWLINMLYGWNEIFPIFHIFLVLAVIVSFEVTILISRITFGIIALIRGSGTPNV